MNDEVLTLLTDRFSELEMKTPLDEIYARGRRHRKTRRLTTAVAAGAAIAAVAGVTAVAVAPTNHPPKPVNTQLTAFSISPGPNGTSALTLRKGQQFRLDPVALRQALAQHGIPALVTVGRACDSVPEPAGLDQAVVAQRHSDGSVIPCSNIAGLTSLAVRGAAAMERGALLNQCEDGLAGEVADAQL